MSEELFWRAIKRTLNYRDIDHGHSWLYSSRIRYYWHLVSNLVYSCWVGIKVLLPGANAVPPGAERSWMDTNAIQLNLFATRRYAQRRVKDNVSWTKFFEGHSTPSPLAMSYLFQKYCHYRCSDPRDRLYGLLGLADDGSAADLYVDYRESTRTVSVRLSKYLVGHGLGGLCFIKHAMLVVILRHGRSLWTIPTLIKICSIGAQTATKTVLEHYSELPAATPSHSPSPRMTSI